MIEVSVIIPCFNAAFTIERAVSSVLIQNFPLEIIIIDDCSVDGSAEVIRTLAAKHREIRLLKSKLNSGPAYCRNMGIELAQGDYIAFLDADDFWLPNKLVAQITFMRSNNILFSFHDYHEIILCGKKICGARTINTPDFAEFPSYYYKRGFGMCLTSIISKNAIGEVRFPDNRSISSEDYGFFLRVLSSGIKGYRLPRTLGVYTVARGSRSANKIRQALSVLRCNIRYANISIFCAFFYFLVYVIHRVLSRFKRANGVIDTEYLDRVVESSKNWSVRHYFQSDERKL
jgi:teichuronic acid biosynthesis glycosyltransferase TuaG